MKKVTFKIIIPMPDLVVGFITKNYVKKPMYGEDWELNNKAYKVIYSDDKITTLKAPGRKRASIETDVLMEYGSRL
jgi:hypothetical protein